MVDAHPPRSRGGGPAGVGGGYQTLHRPATYTARRLRADMSLPEVQLWQHLRGAKAGAKFRRQHVVGDYIVDFYCAAAALVIEIDGAAHGMGDRAEHDQVRDAALRARGLDVHRIVAGGVLKDAGAVAESIAEMVVHRLAARAIEGPLRPLRGHLPASGEDK